MYVEFERVPAAWQAMRTMGYGIKFGLSRQRTSPAFIAAVILSPRASEFEGQIATLFVRKAGECIDYESFVIRALIILLRRASQTSISGTFTG